MVASSTSQNALQFHELLDSSDPYFPAWIDLYRSAFPLQEQLPFEFLLELIARKATGEDREVSLIAVLDTTERMVGLLIYRCYEHQPLAYLWYLAITPEMRGHGTGAEIYRWLIEHLPADIQAMVFEVERPELAETAEQSRLRERRIRFYQRLGASLLGGAVFSIHPNPDTQPVDMNLMVHCLQPITTDRLLELLRQVDEIDRLRPSGTLRFVNPEKITRPV